MNFRFLVRRFYVLSSSLFVLGSPFLFADEWLPPAHELFQPLLADPRELQYALRAVMPLARRTQGEAAMGDYLGLYRWSLGGDKAFQMSVGGGAFARFDLAQKTDDLQTVDFYGNLPFDFRAGPWSTRFLIYHTSGHLGDDYLKSTGLVADKHSWDNLKWLLSYDMASRLRFYGGYNYVFRTLPGGIGRNALQGGFEMQSRWLDGGHAQFYWANDLQSWERVGWNPMFNSQAGCTLANKPGDSRAISIFLEYGTGHMPEGQFYLQQETHWTLGVRFQLT